jgi:DNA-binding NarL/FixJ family response regulator
MEHQESDGRSAIRLSKQTILRLEELRERTGKRSVGDVIEEATEVYARLRSARELAAYQELTPRLRDVLRMIADGSSTKNIASQLNISAKTVEHHRSQLIKKLGIRGIAQLARYAVRVGAVPP